ncbi:MAG TPA: prepilin-type N-terminal cleavage/methylation domain-containing protein [Gallionella sp.]
MRNNSLDRRASAGGLTLIELLVAITVLAVVAVLGWRGLDSIVRARIALTENLEQTRGMQLTFAQLQNDCAQLAPANVLPDHATLIAEQGMLRLVRTVFADNQPARLQIVTYRLRDGVLTRRASAETRDLKELEALWKSEARLDETDAVVLQSGVSELNMRLWVRGRSAWLSAAEVFAPDAKPGQALTGLEVDIRLMGRDTHLTKIFLLGVV